MRKFLLGFCLVVSLTAQCAERLFDFKDVPLDKIPPGFRSVVAGNGQPGDWKIMLDEVAPLLAPLTDKAPAVNKRPVLAQLSQDPTDERFPILIYDQEALTDFTLTTRFKLVGGTAEQMAGIAFRIQDEKNFYVIRASGLGKNLRFYKVVNGVRSAPIGPQVEVARGVWYELKIECKANQIRAWLDGKEAIPTLTDNSFTGGKIGYWTKSDSVSYFADTKLTYVPREPLAQVIVRDMLGKYPRLRGLKIYALDENGQPKIVASKDAAELGTLGGKNEKETIQDGQMFYSKDKKSISVLWPLRDQNGDPMAAVRLNMDSFAGQTEQSALVRARPLVKEMQARVNTLDELIH